jgi:hypothetical protein
VQIPEDVIYPLQAAMEQWTDQRVISAEDLEDLLLFVLYMPKVTSRMGVKLQGFTCRQKQGQYLMTIKAKEEGVPLVVFITGESTIGCMSRFLNLWERDRLSWTKDRYPWI